tara:strand:- start:854 stop:1234 length:381 start_codon:yes stop_codon:yes gene_type:complete
MFDDEIFDGKKFSDLLKEIHTNSKRKEKQINSLIAQLQPLVKNITDATILVPLIKDYLDVGVKNDDALIKMAGIIQRAISRTATEGEDFKLTVDEKNQLLDTVKKTTNVEWEDEAVKDGKNIKFTK